MIAIDPGSDKCGVAVVRRDGHILCRAVIDAHELHETIRDLLTRYKLAVFVLGDRTGSRWALSVLARCCGEGGGPGTEVFLVDEHLTSVEARRRYLKEHPGRGITRFIPPGLRVPDRPYDDYVAIILAERFFAGKWKEKLILPGPI